MPALIAAVLLPWLLLGAGCASEVAARTADNTPPHVTGELLVQFEEDVSPAEAERLVAERNATIISAQQERGLYRIAPRMGLGLEQAMEEFQNTSGVRFVEPNVRHQPYR